MIIAEPDPGGVEPVGIPLVWGTAGEAPVYAANQLAVQVDALGDRPDLVILSLGHASAPILVGPGDRQREQLVKVKEVEVRVVARVSVSVGRLKEWAALLNRTIDALESQEGGQQ